jgi:hypothetical protein
LAISSGSIGKGSDHQIATEAQRGSGAMQFPPSKPQLVRRLIDRAGFVLGCSGRRLD